MVQDSQKKGSTPTKLYFIFHMKISSDYEHNDLKFFENLYSKRVGKQCLLNYYWDPRGAQMAKKTEASHKISPR